MIRNLTTLVLAMTLGACSVAPYEGEKKEVKAEATGEPAATTKEEDPALLGQAIMLKGYISSAFDISVDGQHYDDSEDFYSKQIDVLEKQKNDGGYSEYSLEFEAEVGLGELKNSMEVFVVATADQGFAGETIVLYDGTWEVKLPPEVKGDSFQVRANKRVGVRLTGPTGQVVEWCYNFYGIKMLNLDDKTKPIILKNFKTKLTKYRCPLSSKSILGIPSKKVAKPEATPEAKPTPTPTGVAIPKATPSASPSPVAKPKDGRFDEGETVLPEIAPR